MFDATKSLTLNKVFTVIKGLKLLLIHYFLRKILSSIKHKIKIQVSKSYTYSNILISLVLSAISNRLYLLFAFKDSQCVIFFCELHL